MYDPWTWLRREMVVGWGVWDGEELRGEKKERKKEREKNYICLFYLSVTYFQIESKI